MMLKVSIQNLFHGLGVPTAAFGREGNRMQMFRQFFTQQPLESFLRIYFAVFVQYERLVAPSISKLCQCDATVDVGWGETVLSRLLGS